MQKPYSRTRELAAVFLLASQMISFPALAQSAPTSPRKLGPVLLPPRTAPATPPPQSGPAPNSFAGGAGPVETTPQGKPFTLSQSLEDAKKSPVRRLLKLEELQRPGGIAFGAARFDFRPALSHPASLLNMKKLLGSLEAVRIEEGETFAEERDDGIVLRSSLRFSVRPTACLTPQSKAQMATAGSACLERVELSPATLERQLASPQSLMPIADPTLRARVVADASAAQAAEAAALEGYVAEARASMRTPEGRAQLAARFGEADAAQIASMSDAQIAEAMVNAGTVSLEQTLYVPKLNSIFDLGRLKKLNPDGFDRTIVTSALRKASTNPFGPEKVFDIQGGRSSSIDFLQRLQQAQAQPSTHAFGPANFLTGFTFGREHKWEIKVGYKIDPCRFIPFKDSCPREYFVRPYANLGYGLGMRFPIQVTGQYRYEARSGVTDKATFSVMTLPVDGNEELYRSTGLSDEQLFQGKELVAELGFTAGVEYNLPFRRDNMSLTLGYDFTDLLPGKLKGGQFRPPNTNETIPVGRFTFPEYDLLGQRGNLGFLGVALIPAVQLDMTSKGTFFDLRDRNSGVITRSISTGQPVTLSVNPSGKSRIALENPRYNIGLKIMPGLDAQAFVNIAVWQKKWVWPISFPALSIEIPSGGLEFNCHEGTYCSQPATFQAWRIGSR